MKYSLFLIGILSYSTAHADAAIFKCTIDGVVTFQEEPCKELLNGEEESDAAPYIVIDTSQNNISKQENVTSDVIDRARKQGYYYSNPTRYYPSTNSSRNQYSYDPDEARLAREKAAAEDKKRECNRHRSSAARLQRRMSHGYSHTQSNRLQEKRRRIENNINENC